MLVVPGGALDLVIPEIFPSLSGSVILFLKSTCTNISRLWALQPVGSAGGHPGTSKSREIVGFPKNPYSPSLPVCLFMPLHTQELDLRACTLLPRVSGPQVPVPPSPGREDGDGAGIPLGLACSAQAGGDTSLRQTMNICHLQQGKKCCPEQPLEIF